MFRTRFAFLAVFSLLFGGLPAAADPLRPVSPVVNGCRLGIELERRNPRTLAFEPYQFPAGTEKTLPAGEPVWVKVWLENVTLPFVRFVETAGDEDFSFQAQSKDNKPVPLTAFGNLESWPLRHAGGMRIKRELKIGTRTVGYYLVSRYFDLSNGGSFSITANRQVYLPDGRRVIYSAALPITFSEWYRVEAAENRKP